MGYLLSSKCIVLKGKLPFKYKAGISRSVRYVNYFQLCCQSLSTILESFSTVIFWEFWVHVTCISLAGIFLQTCIMQQDVWPQKMIALKHSSSRWEEWGYSHQCNLHKFYTISRSLLNNLVLAALWLSTVCYIFKK